MTAARPTLALTLVCLCLAGCAAPAAPALEQAYSRDPGFAFNYPAGWVILRDDQSSDSTWMALGSEADLEWEGQASFKPGQSTLVVLAYPRDPDNHQLDDAALSFQDYLLVTTSHNAAIDEIEAPHLVTINGQDYALGVYQLTRPEGISIGVFATRISAQHMYGVFGFAAVEDQATYVALFKAVLATLEFNP